MMYNVFRKAVDNIKLYTVKQVAEMIGYKEGSIRNMISDGRIKAVKVGGSTRITKEALEEFTGLKVGE